ncbi:hypothetical protein [Bosea vaviloviae]|uniref:Uncharacterized protein n=1 Tax=Bosea vaviloviae TaxID=1526658 RepID=A0A1D7U1I5_9HYPH|nr:hypothetical protein [Bosea vaviloviae]AOO81242.1 hypothetical protein BHK69_12890 [Bosea vaviloviae]
MGVLRHAVAAMLLLGSNAALAQTVTAYQSGLRIAEGRGYANAGCYAQVFAKHAVVVEKANGRRNWHAASTPAYNAEQHSRCGIDRLADRAARRQEGQTAGYSAPRAAGQIYAVGLKIAAERGHSGAKAACFARTYATYASSRPSASGRAAYAVSGRNHTSYAAELSSQCGISR